MSMITILIESVKVIDAEHLAWVIFLGICLLLNLIGALVGVWIAEKRSQSK